jgi:hypothetical protein
MCDCELDPRPKEENCFHIKDVNKKVGKIWIKHKD